jgi:hypothetical protein
MSGLEPGDDEFAALVKTCGYLGSFLDKGTWQPLTPLEELVLRTLARGRGTFETIVELADSNRTLQAAMLGRSLFEDMVVVHWLVLHRDAPDWLIQRFNAHADAMRLHDATVRGQMRRGSIDDVADLRGHEEELRREFGLYAERDWWGKTRDGQRISMPQLVVRLASERRFHPRLRGEQPILEQYYALQQKAWTQALHHTAVGTLVGTVDGGAFPHSVAGPGRAIILFGNYWVLGQLIFAALELGADAGAIAYFQKVFLAGLAVFGAVLDMPVPWEEDVARWAAETPDEHRDPSR